MQRDRLKPMPGWVWGIELRKNTRRKKEEMSKWDGFAKELIEKEQEAMQTKGLKDGGAAEIKWDGKKQEFQVGTLTTSCCVGRKERQRGSPSVLVCMFVSMTQVITPLKRGCSNAYFFTPAHLDEQGIQEAFKLASGCRNHHTKPPKEPMANGRTLKMTGDT